MSRLLQIFLALLLPLIFLSQNCSNGKKTQGRFNFVKTVVAESFNEPVQLGELPDGKIILIERHGAIKLFDPATNLINVAYELPVVDTLEDGLLGLAIDPNWVQNHWIYLYYSPVGVGDVNYLSRFVFENGALLPSSEKILLKIPVQRQECCHSGGGLVFGADSCLYLGVGDNTNPTDDYSSLDERPGRAPWDSQKSSANTMDFRGKILRIKVQDDGTYICPKGNLFSPLIGGQGGTPEIFIMGCRNPFRVTFDERRKALFWADVGPDASNPDTLRGPMGYDEINCARKAGNYGWPYFIADNKPYRDYDYTTKQSGAWFDPQNPVNESPNSTGAHSLPPARPAMIWYPYSFSQEFPVLGDDGRSAMVGPVYYADKYPEATRLPDHFDGKLFIYDWMRNWIIAVEMDTVGNYIGMERFADGIPLICPIDMLIDKNGTMWVLEYGTEKYSANPDSRLSRIDYVRGNRAPVPALEADKTAGAAPLQVVFSVAKTHDSDEEDLTFNLDFRDGSKVWEKTVKNNVNLSKSGELDNIVHVFEKPGTYEVTLKVMDESGRLASVKKTISVGNAPPLVSWDLGGKNRSFYQPGDLLNYRITVEDLEDGSLESGTIALDSVTATIDYLASGFDIAALIQTPQTANQPTEFAKGKVLMERFDCKTCHAVDRTVVGPSFKVIAERYRNDASAMHKLSRKVIEGGIGNWGQVGMNAHPNLPEADVSEIVRWVLSLGQPPKPKQSLPTAGNYALETTGAGTFILKATYRDRGSSSQTPLESSTLLALRPAFQQAEQADSISKGVAVYRPFDDDAAALNQLKHNSFFVFKHSDLVGIQSVTVNVGLGDARNKFVGGRLELRLGLSEGTVVGSVEIPAKNISGKMEFLELILPVSAPSDGAFYDLYFVFKNENNPSQTVTAVDWVHFNLKGQSRFSLRGNSAL